MVNIEHCVHFDAHTRIEKVLEYSLNRKVIAWQQMLNVFFC